MDAGRCVSNKSTKLVKILAVTVTVTVTVNSQPRDDC